MKKILSVMLSSIVAMFAPGFGCWQALAVEVNNPVTSVRTLVLPVSLNNNIVPFQTNSQFEGAEISVEKIGTEDAVQPQARGEIFPAETSSVRVDENQSLETSGGISQAVEPQTRSFKATLAKHAARVIKMTRNIRQAVADHIAGRIANWSNLLVRLRTDWSGIDAKALGTTAYVINSRAWNFVIPAVQNIVAVAKGLEGKTVQIDVAKWAKLEEAGQAPRLRRPCQIIKPQLRTLRNGRRCPLVFRKIQRVFKRLFKRSSRRAAKFRLSR